MTDAPTVLLHLKGLNLPPLPMRVVRSYKGGPMIGECVVQVQLVTADIERTLTIPPENCPTLIGPSGEAVTVTPISAITVCPGDTLIVTATLSPDSLRKLGLPE